MKDSYHIKGNDGSIAVTAWLTRNVVCDPQDNEWFLNRIAVMRGYPYGTGLGTELLKVVIADADKEGVTLVLGIEPDDHVGPKYFRRLARWYGRHGFVREDKGPLTRYHNVMIRRPR